MKLLFYDGFDKCSKCIYLLGIELLELIGKSIHSIGRFLSLADTPFFVRSSASRLENCSSYMSNHHPSLLYCSLEDSQK